MNTLLALLFFGLLVAALVFTGLYIYKVMEANEKRFGRNGSEEVKRPRLIMPVACYAASFLALCLWMSYVQVDSGYTGVVYRNGQAITTVDPGAHLIIPFVESMAPVCSKTLVVKPNEGGSSNDLQQVTTQVTLAYHFDPKYAMYFATKLIDNNDNAVENKVVYPAIIEAVKAVTARYTAQELITKRPQVRDEIEAFVKARLAEYHIVAETTSITDFNFSKEFNDAIESKVTAQQRAEQANNDLQRIKVEAEQKVAAAEGEAQALRAQKEQITPELLQLRTIEMLRDKWDGKLPENYYGGTAPLPIVDVLKNAGKK